MSRTKGSGIKTECKRGHLRIPENLDAFGKCKLCRIARDRAKGTLSWEDRKLTHCKKRNHPRTPDNVGPQGHCLACKKIDDAEYVKKAEVKAKIKAIMQTAEFKKRRKAYTDTDEYRQNQNEAQRSPEFRAKMRIKEKKEIEEIAESYIAELMGLTVQQLTPKIIKLKREALITKRTNSELKTILKGRILK